MNLTKSETFKSFSVLNNFLNKALLLLIKLDKTVEQSVLLSCHSLKLIALFCMLAVVGFYFLP